VHDLASQEEAEEADSLVWSVVRAFDVAVDHALDGRRGDPRLDRSAAVISNLADYGFVWAVIALTRARHGGPRRRRAVRALVVAGVTSFTVNFVVKQLVRRQRPEGPAGDPGAPGAADEPPGAADEPGGGAHEPGAGLGGGDGIGVAPAGLPVRVPTSSSFPSGHTLAATCTAIVFADSTAQLVLFGGFAGSVALSRVYLRHHHASDVLGGLVIGTAAGVLGRRIVGPPPIATRPSR
jgi:undecaprenyl-diphosphatase